MSKMSIEDLATKFILRMYDIRPTRVIDDDESWVDFNELTRRIGTENATVIVRDVVKGLRLLGAIDINQVFLFPVISKEICLTAKSHFMPLDLTAYKVSSP